MSTLSGLVAAFLAALVPGAAAHQPFAAGAQVTARAHIQVLPVRSTPADRRSRTCNARGANSQSNRVERQLAPVACEQPPRSKVILTLDGGLFGSGH